MDPILFDIPETIVSERLTLRVPRPGDGAALAKSVRASVAELSPWLPWATEAYGPDDGELFCRRSLGDFHLRRQLVYVLWNSDGAHVGGIGAHRVDWKSRTCEVGYWLRTDRVGRGYMSEALDGLFAMLTSVPALRRVEVRCDVRNERSAAVARRAGFAHEGMLRGDALDVASQPRDTHIFSRVVDR